MTDPSPTAIAALFQAPVIALALTWAAFEIGRWVQARCGGSALANPVLIAAMLIIPALELGDVSYESYMRGAGFIHFLLGPAAVALAVPIYDNLDRIRHSAAAILAAIAAGATIAAVGAVGIAWWLGASPEVVRSIAPKSVTTPIAIGISQEIGGLPSMTVVLVIITGVLGAMLCGRFFDLIGVRDSDARGVAAGVAGHGIATAQILTTSRTGAAFAALAMGLTGLFTAFLLPLAARLLPSVPPG
ncbi:MAG TPA: LrgB family protein [Stellaceae bacterium]